MTNILLTPPPEEEISRLLALIGQPARIRILFAISTQEACVCHLEAVLGLRQASISQHLMALRKAGLVSTQRDGRNIFYRLANKEAIMVLQQAASLSGNSLEALEALSLRPVTGCPCPQCNPGMDPNLSCQKIRIR